MSQQAIRKSVTVEKVLKHNSGWFERELYDADAATKQESVDEEKKKSSLMFMFMRFLGRVIMDE